MHVVAAIDFVGVSILVSTLTASLTSVLAALRAHQAARTSVKVHREVATAPGHTLAGDLTELGAKVDVGLGAASAIGESLAAHYARVENTYEALHQSTDAQVAAMAALVSRIAPEGAAS